MKVTVDVVRWRCTNCGLIFYTEKKDWPYTLRCPNLEKADKCDERGRVDEDS